MRELYRPCVNRVLPLRQRSQVAALDALEAVAAYSVVMPLGYDNQERWVHATRNIRAPIVTIGTAGAGRRRHMTKAGIAAGGPAL
jgi:hypothetical protein